MTHCEELKRIFPNGSTDFLAANSGPVAVVESGSSNAPLGAKEVQGSTSARFLVRITSVRKRLLDGDNACEKYHVDLCRYAGVIPGDAPSQVKIETRQQRAEKGEAEHTMIEVFKESDFVEAKDA